MTIDNTYYDQLAPDYDNDRFNNSYGRYIHARETAILDAWLPKRAQQVVLDMACGTGRLLNYATHGADLSPAMVAEARKKFPAKDIRIASAEALPWNDQNFDAVTCFHLFMHLDVDAFSNICNEAWRVLQPGGWFIFDMPSQKRRQLLRQKRTGWHGSFSMNLQQIKQATATKWNYKKSRGILFLPIHRLPGALRAACKWLDALLARSFVKQYASYMVVALQKKVA